MLYDDDPLLLAPNFSLIVRWAARVNDFIAEWEQREAQAHPGDPLGFWEEAASAALSRVERGCHQAQDVLADIYSVTGLLPNVEDLLLVEPLEIKVEERRFSRRLVGVVAHVEVVVYLGVERYRYETLPAQVGQQLSSATVN